MLKQKPKPYIWLQEYEAEGKAHCGCRLESSRDDRGSAFYQCPLHEAAPGLLEALKFQASWKMRDGSLCACPAGKNEDEPRGKMPLVHSTSCEMLRAAIAKTGR